MSDPITDESIDSFVTMVEAAEILGDSLGMKTSLAMRTMLKSMQIMTHLQNSKANAFLQSLTSPVKGPQ